LFIEKWRGVLSSCFNSRADIHNKGRVDQPTVYGNVLLGPTAEDLDDKLQHKQQRWTKFLLAKGHQIFPQHGDEEVTAPMRSARCDGTQRLPDCDGCGTKIFMRGGIRSTGISSALGIAEYSVSC